jgi:hypothetical protein
VKGDDFGRSRSDYEHHVTTVLKHPEELRRISITGWWS